MASPFDDLPSMPGLAGDVARAELANPPIPLETPEDTQKRIAQTQQTQQRIQRIRGADLAARGIPTYTTAEGSVEPVRGSDGVALTGYDKRNNVAWDSQGKPVSMQYGESGAPEVKDAWSGAETIVDKKDGSTYKVRAGLPWQWTGFDPEAKAAAERDHEQKQLGVVSRALGRKLTIDEHDLKAGHKAREKAREELVGMVPTLGELDGADENGVIGAIDKHFDTLYGDSNAQEKTGLFGTGDYTEEALKYRSGIDQQRARAHQLARGIFSTGKDLEGLSARVAQERGMARAVAGKLSESELAELGITFDGRPEGTAPVGKPVTALTGFTQPAPASVAPTATGGVKQQQNPGSLAQVLNSDQYKDAPLETRVGAIKKWVDDYSAFQRATNPKWDDAKEAEFRNQFVDRSGFTGAIRELATGIWSGIVDRAPEDLARVIRGGDVKLHGNSWTDQLIAEQDADRQNRARSYQEAAGGKLATALQQGPQSMVTSLATAIGGMKAGAMAGGAIGATMGAPAGGVGAAPGAAVGASIGSLVGAATLSGASMYRIAKDTFLEQVRDKVLKEAPEMSEQEWDEVKNSVESAAQQYGLWEAGPEALSQAFTAGLFSSAGGTILRRVIPGFDKLATGFAENAIAKVVGKYGGVTAAKLGAEIGEEVATETLTSYGQGGVEAKAGLRDKAPTVGEAFEEAAGPAAVGAVLQGGVMAGLEHLTERGKAAPDPEPQPQPEQPQQAIQSGGPILDVDATVSPAGESGSTGTGEQPGDGGAPVTPTTDNAPTGGVPGNVAAATETATGEETATGTDPVEEQPSPEAEEVSTTAVTPATPEVQQATVSGTSDLTDPVSTVQSSPVDAAAHEAATSPSNDRPEPTEAQRKAGNYAKGHTRISGLDISVENPEGATRSGKDADGKPWSVQMKAHYGYIKRTEGKDGDHVDVFIKPGTPQDWDGTVYVVNQKDPSTGSFDEHKVILGARSEMDAQATYLSNYAPGWKGLGSIRTFKSVADFKAWLPEAKKARPRFPKETAQQSQNATTENQQPTHPQQPTETAQSQNATTQDPENPETWLPEGVKGGRDKDHFATGKMSPQQAEAFSEAAKTHGWERVGSVTYKDGTVSVTIRKPAKQSGSTEAPKPQNRTISKDDAKAAVESVKPQIESDLKRLGVKAITFQNYIKDEKTPGSGIKLREDGVILIDPERLARSMETIRDNQEADGIQGTPEDWVRTALEEEGIHSAQHAVAREEGKKNAVQYYESVPDDYFPRDLMEQAAKYYGFTLGEQYTGQQKAEAVRMVVQGRWRGRITEGLHKILRDLVAFLKRAENLDGASDWFKNHVQKVEERVNGLKPEQKQAPAAEAPKPPKPPKAKPQPEAQRPKPRAQRKPEAKQPQSADAKKQAFHDAVNDLKSALGLDDDLSAADPNSVESIKDRLEQSRLQLVELGKSIRQFQNDADARSQALKEEAHTKDIIRRLTDRIAELREIQNADLNAAEPERRSDIAEVAERHNVRFDGQIELPGVPRYQFTVEDPASPAHKATFLLKGEFSEKAFIEKLRAFTQTFAGNGDLSAAEPTEHKSIPRAHRAAVLKVADAAMDAGYNTPETLYRNLSEVLGEKHARSYVNAIWLVMRSENDGLSDVSRDQWASIFAGEQQQQPEAPAQEGSGPDITKDTKAFVEKVQEVAHSLPESALYGPIKAWISELYPAMNYPGTLEEFKQHLAKANREGLLGLGRFDMPADTPEIQAKSSASLLQSRGEEFRFVLLDRRRAESTQANRKDLGIGNKTTDANPISQADTGTSAGGVSSESATTQEATPAATDSTSTDETTRAPEPPQSPATPPSAPAAADTQLLAKPGEQAGAQGGASGAAVEPIPSLPNALLEALRAVHGRKYSHNANQDLSGSKETIKNAKERAKEKGWNWSDVEKMAQKALGLDDQWRTEEEARQDKLKEDQIADIQRRAKDAEEEAAKEVERRQAEKADQDRKEREKEEAAAKQREEERKRGEKIENNLVDEAAKAIHPTVAKKWAESTTKKERKAIENAVAIRVDLARRPDLVVRALEAASSAPAAAVAEAAETQQQAPEPPKDTAASATAPEPAAAAQEQAPEGAKPERKRKTDQSDEPEMPEVTAPGVSPDDIPLELATRAHSGTSFLPERRGRAEQRGYVEHMNAVWESFLKRAETDAQREIAKAQFSDYRRKWVEQEKMLLSRRGSLVSSMIAGPSKFPARQQGKKGDAYQKRVGEFLEWDKRAQKAAKEAIRPTPPRFISSDRSDAVEQLQKKIDAARADQERMKAVNAAHKKFLKDPASLEKSGLTDTDKELVRRYKPAYSWEPHPFAPFQLTNNNANIKRMEERVAQLTKERAKPETSATFDGGRVDENAANNRIQIFFDEKPDAATREKLKANGFRWAPSEGAWQRQRNENSRYAVEQVLGVKLEPAKAKETTQADTDDNVVEFTPQPETDTESSDGSLNAAAPESPAFKRWFGNSKVVDGNGAPLVVYHGTKSDITEFKPSRGGEFGSGVYFSPNPDTAEMFGSYQDGDEPVRVMPVFLKIENPLITNDRNVPRGAGVKKLKKQGYDGIIGTTPSGQVQYVAFDPEQIKSAIANDGSYDVDDSNSLSAAMPEARETAARLSAEIGDETLERRIAGLLESGTVTEPTPQPVPEPQKRDIPSDEENGDLSAVEATGSEPIQDVEKYTAEQWENREWPFKTWYVHGRGNRTDLNTGHVIMATKDADVAALYAKGKEASVWAIRPKSNAVVWDMGDTDTQKKIMDALMADYDAGVLPAGVDTTAKTVKDQTDGDASHELWIENLNPENLSLNGNFWDDPDSVSWVYERFGVDGVKIQNDNSNPSRDSLVMIDRNGFDLVRVVALKNGVPFSKDGDLSAAEPEPSEKRDQSQNATTSQSKPAKKPMRDRYIEHWFKRLMSKGRWFWEGTADVFKRAGFHELHAAVWKQQDETAKAFAHAWMPTHKVLQTLKGSALKQAKKEFGEYFAAKESNDMAKRDEADAILSGASEGGKALIRAWKETGLLTGEVMQKLGVKVKDGSKWRKIGFLGEDAFPRKIKRKVQKILDDPEAYPAEWEAMVSELQMNGNIQERSEADKYIREYFYKDESDSDYYASMEKARKKRLPDSWMETSFDEIVPWYVTNYSRRIGQIAAYGQTTDTTKDLWDQVLETIPPRKAYLYTREYIKAAKDAAYMTRRNDSLNNTLRNLQAFATGAFLSNPYSAIRNAVSGQGQNLVHFGAVDTMKAAWTAMTSAKERLGAHELGILRADLYSIMMEGRDDTEINQRLRQMANKGLEYTGFNLAENWVRVTSMVAAKNFVRNASETILKNANSSKALQYRAFLQRHGFDPLELAKERGDGKLTENFIRKAVTETQFSYTFAQTPLYHSLPGVSFMLQFQKWGTQATRFLAEHVIGPAVKGTKVQTANGEKTVRSWRPLIYALAFAAGGGELLYLIKELFTGRERNDATLEEIAGASRRNDNATAASHAASRILSDVIMAGSLGILGDYGANLREFAVRGRFKNPFSPPGLQIAKSLGDIVRTYQQQGKITFDDVSDLLASQLPGSMFLTRWAKNVTGDKTQEAENVKSLARAAGRRMATEMDLPVRGSFGMNDPIKTPNTPLNNAMERALLSGNVNEARRLVAERLKQAKDAEHRKRMLTGLKASVSQSQPIAVGGIASAQNRQAFLAWAPNRLDKDDFRRIAALDQKYWQTAIAAGIAEEMPKPRKKTFSNPLTFTGF